MNFTFLWDTVQLFLLWSDYLTNMDCLIFSSDNFGSGDLNSSYKEEKELNSFGFISLRSPNDRKKTIGYYNRTQ